MLSFRRRSGSAASLWKAAVNTVHPYSVYRALSENAVLRAAGVQSKPLPYKPRSRAGQRPIAIRTSMEISDSWMDELITGAPSTSWLDPRSNGQPAAATTLKSSQTARQVVVAAKLRIPGTMDPAPSPNNHDRRKGQAMATQNSLGKLGRDKMKGRTVHKDNPAARSNVSRSAKKGKRSASPTLPNPIGMVSPAFRARETGTLFDLRLSFLPPLPFDDEFGQEIRRLRDLYLKGDQADQDRYSASERAKFRRYYSLWKVVFRRAKGASKRALDSIRSLEQSYIDEEDSLRRHSRWLNGSKCSNPDLHIRICQHRRRYWQCIQAIWSAHAEHISLLGHESRLWTRLVRYNSDLMDSRTSYLHAALREIHISAKENKNLFFELTKWKPDFPYTSPETAISSGLSPVSRFGSLWDPHIVKAFGTESTHWMVVNTFLQVRKLASEAQEIAADMVQEATAARGQLPDLETARVTLPLHMFKYLSKVTLSALKHARVRRSAVRTDVNEYWRSLNSFLSQLTALLIELERIVQRRVLVEAENGTLQERKAMILQAYRKAYDRWRAARLWAKKVGDRDFKAWNRGPSMIRRSRRLVEARKEVTTGDAHTTRLLVVRKVVRRRARATTGVPSNSRRRRVSKKQPQEASPTTADPAPKDVNPNQLPPAVGRKGKAEARIRRLPTSRGSVDPTSSGSSHGQTRNYSTWLTTWRGMQEEQQGCPSQHGHEQRSLEAPSYAPLKDDLSSLNDLEHESVLATTAADTPSRSELEETVKSALRGNEDTLGNSVLATPHEEEITSGESEGYGSDTLQFQIPDEELRKAMLASPHTGAAYWHHDLYRGPKGTSHKITVHYCRSKQLSEKIAPLFLNKSVLGFDIEWRPNATARDGIKANASLIQLASEDRIALFHIGKFQGSTIEELVPPTLKNILERSDIIKAGVSIKSDCTRLRRYLGIEARGLFELSHAYKLVKYATIEPEKVNKRLVSLATQVHEHLLLPLSKGVVRASDWSKELKHDQVVYAATDAYAGFRLYHELEAKRKKLWPPQPRPAFCELDEPIRVVRAPSNRNFRPLGAENAPREDGTVRPLQARIYGSNSQRFARSEFFSTESSRTLGAGDLGSSVSSQRFPSPGDNIGFRDLYKSTSFSNTDIPAVITYPVLPMDTSQLESFGGTPTPNPTSSNEERQITKGLTTKSAEFLSAEAWIEQWITSLPSTRALKVSRTQLQAYALWHVQSLDIAEAGAHIRDPPLAVSTVSNYVLSTILLEDLSFDPARVEQALANIPLHVARGRYRSILAKARNMGRTKAVSD